MFLFHVFPVIPDLLIWLFNINPFKYYLSCVYGHPVPKFRNQLWERLQRIAVNRSGP